MSGWISVEKDLPDLIEYKDIDTVLALNKDGYICVCWAPDEFNKWLLSIPGYDDDVYLEGVTHWMPLPKLPGEEES